MKQDLINKEILEAKKVNSRTLYQLHPHLGFWGKGLKGSITMETAIVLPIFLLAIAYLISWIGFLDIERSLAAEANAKARDLAAESFILEPGEADFVEVVKGDYLRGVYFVKKAKARAFTGRYYPLNPGDEEAKKLVFVTKSGSVYHRSLICSHLKLSIKSTDVERIKGLRNKKGEKYRPCDFCKKKTKGEVIYFTDYGNRYHRTKTCKGIKRSIKITSLKMAKSFGLGSCKKCGGYFD